MSGVAHSLGSLCRAVKLVRVMVPYRRQHRIKAWCAEETQIRDGCSQTLTLSTISTSRNPVLSPEKWWIVSSDYNAISLLFILKCWSVGTGQHVPRQRASDHSWTDNQTGVSNDQTFLQWGSWNVWKRKWWVFLTIFTFLALSVKARNPVHQHG